MKLVRRAKRDDLDFLKKSMKDKRYISNISGCLDECSISLKGRMIYIVEYNDQLYGFFEYYQWNKDNRNISLNIFMNQLSNMINGQTLLTAGYIAFEKLKVEKLIIKVAQHNNTMIKILEKLGIKREGFLKNVVRRKGKYISIFIYGLLREEYLRLKRRYNG